MAIETVCGGCGKQLAVDDSFAGRKAKCPVCGFVYVVPGYPVASNPYAEANLPTPPDVSPPAANPSAFDASSSGSNSTGSYWVKTPDGNVYGPGDRATLSRWFTEGRLTPGSTVREGTDGPWKSLAELGFQTTSNNPFADQAYQPPGNLGMPVGYARPDRSGLVLAMGILSWVLCPIFGIVAWIMGSADVREMKAGRMDSRNMALTQVGLYVGMVHIILALLCGGGYIALIVSLAATGNLR